MTRFVASRNTAVNRLMRLGAVVNDLQQRFEANPANDAVLADIDRIAAALDAILADFPDKP